MTDVVDPDFSLGLIIWHPAVEKKRPLPATFREAELEDLAQAKPPKDEEESISKYFVNSRKHEVELSIRQTDDWEEVKNDLIFVEFPETCEVVPLLTIIENRVRPDPSREKEKSPFGEPVQAGSNVQQPQTLQPVSDTKAVAESQDDNNADDTDGDQAMDMSDDEDEEEPVKLAPVPERQLKDIPEFVQVPRVQPTRPQQLQRKTTNVLDSLEKALGPNAYIRGNKPSRPPPSVRYSRSRSPEKMNRSRQGSHQPKAKPTAHPRDAAQESVLAALGVEGSPKMVYPTPPPALCPPASPDRYVLELMNTKRLKLMHCRNGARSPDKFGQSAFHTHPLSLPYGPNFPPPPPPRDIRSPSFDPWKAHDAFHGIHRRSPSTTSQHTAAGSDFYPDGNNDMDATPRAKVAPPPSSHGGPESGRKRTYDHMTEPEIDKRRRQEDDTPRARRKTNYDRTDAYRCV